MATNNTTTTSGPELASASMTDHVSTEALSTGRGESAVADKIRAYVADHFLCEFGDELNDDSDLFAAGIVDSFGFVELVVFLESQFSIKFEGEELVADGLNSVSNMVSSVSRKQLGAS